MRSDRSVTERILNVLRPYASNWSGTLGRGDLVIPQREIPRVIHEILDALHEDAATRKEAGDRELFDVLMAARRRRAAAGRSRCGKTEDHRAAGMRRAVDTSSPATRSRSGMSAAPAFAGRGTPSALSTGRHSRCPSRPETESRVGLLAWPARPRTTARAGCSG